MDYLCVHYVQLVLRVFIAISQSVSQMTSIVYHRFHLAGFHKTPSPVHRPRKSIEKANLQYSVLGRGKTTSANTSIPGSKHTMSGMHPEIGLEEEYYKKSPRPFPLQKR